MEEEYGQLKASWAGFAGYDRWFSGKPNNATLASVALYTEFVPAFRAMLEREGGELPRFYAAVKELARLSKEDRDARLSAGAPASLRLAARNVVGKVLLARASFEEANEHFAADASDAACIGDTTSELRARLNRAIALMSSCRYAEARAMLEGVRAAGEERA
jgi:hypothetical protein